jgi:hypothetical protein
VKLGSSYTARVHDALNTPPHLGTGGCAKMNMLHGPARHLWLVCMGFRRALRQAVTVGWQWPRPVLAQ